MANPALILPFQAGHYAAAEVNYSDAAGDVVINLPQGALLLGVYRINDVAFDGTGASLTVGSASGGTQYLTSAVTAATTAYTTPGLLTAAAPQVIATFAPGTSATTGHAYIVAHYLPLNITGCGSVTSKAVTKLQA